MFTYKKAVQALNYFAREAGKEGVSLYKTNALKLIYFADKKHIREQHLRTITGDSYIAKQMGPVARDTCDLIETQADKSEQEAENMCYAEEFIESKRGLFSRERNIRITSKKEVDEKVFSKSDLSALAFVWERCKKIIASAPKEGGLWKKIHEYPEGRKAEAGKPWSEIKEEELFSVAENDMLGEQGQGDLKTAKERYQDHKEAAKAFGVES